jgi:hypothetical protein
MDQITFCADHRLRDTLALQLFMLKSHLLRRGLFLVVCLLGAVVINTLMNGAPLSDALMDLQDNALRYLVIVLVGLAVIYLIALLLAVLAWRRRPKPRQIRATITADKITLQKEWLLLRRPLGGCRPGERKFCGLSDEVQPALYASSQTRLCAGR